MKVFKYNDVDLVKFYNLFEFIYQPDYDSMFIDNESSSLFQKMIEVYKNKPREEGYPYAKLFVYRDNQLHVVYRTISGRILTWDNPYLYVRGLEDSVNFREFLDEILGSPIVEEEPEHVANFLDSMEYLRHELSRITWKFPLDTTLFDVTTAAETVNNLLKVLRVLSREDYDTFIEKNISILDAVYKYGNELVAMDVGGNIIELINKYTPQGYEFSSLSNFCFKYDIYNESIEVEADRFGFWEIEK